MDLVFRRGLFHVEERGRVPVRPPRSLSCKLREMSCLHANHHCTVHDDATARHIMLYDFISIHGQVSLTSRVPLKENTCVKISTTSALLVETVLNNILVVIEIDGRKPWCSHETLAGIRIRKSLPQHMMMHINFMRYAERSGEGAWSKAPRPR